MSDIYIIIQARMGSSRLPGKTMKDLAGHPMIWHVVTRALRSRKAKGVIVATTTNPEDDVVEKFCKENNFLYYRGSSDNVLERYYKTAKQFHCDIIIRVTGDCPLIDPYIIDLCIEKFKRSRCDYISNIIPGERTFPRGLDAEVFYFKALEKAYHSAKESYEKEHATSYIWQNKKKEFRIGQTMAASLKYRGGYRLTVDYPEDFLLMEEIYKNFYNCGYIIDVKKVIEFLDKNPKIASANAHCIQKTI